MQKPISLQKTYSQAFLFSSFYNSKLVYAQRRKKMLSKLDAPCVFAGVQVEPGCDEAFASTWTRFVQDPAFLFLTGVNQAGCYLLLDPISKSEILFVPYKDSYKEFWMGKKLGYYKNHKEAGGREVAKVTGFKRVEPADKLWEIVGELCNKKLPCDNQGKAYMYGFFYEKFKGDHNDRFSLSFRRFLNKKNVGLRSAASFHYSLRLPLDKGRVLEALAAQKVTDKAFRSLLSNFSSFENERDVALFLNYQMQRGGDGDLAFPTIAAGGENACCLHYVKNDEPLVKGKLILLDFGIRIGTLHSDISRTIPVSGKFNPLQKLLYQIVLDAGEEYKKWVKPGVTLNEVGMVPWNFIVDQLETRLVQKFGGTYKLMYDCRPHGVSHFIGEHIHEGDPGSRSLDVVLEPGMLISCEPGLYGDFCANISGKRYKERIGIRIEDDLLITASGYENISRHIPKTVEEIELLMTND